MWYVRAINMPALWDITMCDPSLCYTLYSPPTNELHAFNATAGFAYQLKFGVSPNCQAGSGWYEAIMWLRHDSAASVQTIKFFATYNGACTTGIMEEHAGKLRVYPSPFTNQFVIEGLAGSGNYTAKIFDASGRMVFEKIIGPANSQVTITPELSVSGNYLLAIETAGKRIYSQSITRQ
jgi:hypothetical protein